MTSNDYTESLLNPSAGSPRTKYNYKSLENNNNLSLNTNTNNTNPDIIQQQNDNDMNSKEFLNPNKNDNKNEDEFEYKLSQNNQNFSINSGSHHEYNDSQAALISRQQSEDQAIQKQSTGYYSYSYPCTNQIKYIHI